MLLIQCMACVSCAQPTFSENLESKILVGTPFPEEKTTSFFFFSWSINVCNAGYLQYVQQGDWVPGGHDISAFSRHGLPEEESARATRGGKFVRSSTVSSTILSSVLDSNTFFFFFSEFGVC